MTDFREGGPFCPTPPSHPWAAPKTPILNRVKVCLPSAREQDRADKNSLQFWKTGYLDVAKRETVEPHINHLMRSYNYYLQFLYNWYQFIAIAFHLCLSSLRFYALHLQLCRNHVKEISRNFKDPARVNLTVLQKNVIFWRFQNGSMNLFGITSEKSFLFPKQFY